MQTDDQKRDSLVVEQYEEKKASREKERAREPKKVSKTSKKDNNKR